VLGPPCCFTKKAERKEGEGGLAPNFKNTGKKKRKKDKEWQIDRKEEKKEPKPEGMDAKRKGKRMPRSTFCTVPKWGTRNGGKGKKKESFSVREGKREKYKS